MKTIYLYEPEKGWISFDYESETIQDEFMKRSITIGDDAVIGSGAVIGDGAVIVRSIFITGTRHLVNWYSTEILHIGCHKKEIDWWLENYETIGKKEGYTEDQIKEYYGYIMICKQMYDNL